MGEPSQVALLVMDEHCHKAAPAIRILMVQAKPGILVPQSPILRRQFLLWSLVVYLSYAPSSQYNNSICGLGEGFDGGVETWVCLAGDKNQCSWFSNWSKFFRKS
mmetsp:Transcript_33365/g.76877  ORF Transcript_33365/g.76877 Transcript_33365/m.76877 type:complete len:105 (-) Transcript_33365:162-476(-)